MDIHVYWVGPRWRSVAVLIAASAMLMTLPYAMESEATSPEDETVLRIGFMQKVDSLNPNRGMTDASHIFYGLVYDCLQCVAGDLQPEPNLALDWTIVDDFSPYGSVCEYTLTQNAYWHDGEPLTSEDVAFTLNLNADYYPAMWMYQPYTFYMDFAEVVDDYTVRVHFYDRFTNDPMPVAFADSLFIPILPEHLLRNFTPMDISFNWEGVFEDHSPPLVGTGPFMATEDIYDEFTQGDKLTLVRNPDYHWTADRDIGVKFDRLEMHFFDDATAMRYALEAGEIEVAQFPPEEYAAIKDGVDSGTIANVTAFDGPKCTQYWTYIGFNMNDYGPNPSRLDPVIRQALAMATNKEYINDNFYLGLGEPGTTLIPPVNDVWHYEPADEELYHYDLDAANALLEAAGYRYTEASPDFRVCTVDSWACQEGLVPEDFQLSYDLALRQEYPEEKDVAIYLVNEWKKIGVDLDYTIMTERALGAYVYAYSYDLVMWDWSSDPDPTHMLFCQSKSAWNGWSDNRYYNPEYEANFTASVQELDVDLRKSYVADCQKIHYGDAAYIVLDYVDQKYAWRTDTFAGWGDWGSDPGRSIDAYWGGNPLYFDLRPIGHGPPVTESSVSGTEGDSGWHTSPVQVTLSVLSTDSELDWTRYRVNGTDWVEYAGPVEIAADGIHEFEYRSKDVDNFYEETRSIDIKVDKTSPELEVSDGQAKFDSSTPTITWSCTDSCSGVRHVEYSLDDGAFEVCAEQGSVQLVNVSDGLHTIRLVIFDNAGNNATVTFEFEVDTSGIWQDVQGSAYFWAVAGAAAIIAAIAVATLLMRRSGGRKTPPGGDSLEGDGPP